MPFQFFSGGSLYSPAMEYYLYFEVLASALPLIFSLIYLYYVFWRGGRPFLDSISRKLFHKFETPVVDEGYNRYIPRAVGSISRKLFHKFETPVVDEGYNRKLVDGVLRAGARLSRAHGGDLSVYLLWVVLGFFIVLVWIILQLWL